jgi:hypothetical protein
VTTESEHVTRGGTRPTNDPPTTHREATYWPLGKDFAARRTRPAAPPRARQSPVTGARARAKTTVRRDTSADCNGTNSRDLGGWFPAGVVLIEKVSRVS